MIAPARHPPAIRGDRRHIDVSGILAKIDEHLAALSSRRFTVVLFGAFADGKTSVISALTRRLGLAIGPGPTTDRLQTYEYRDVLLVDVPGLFSTEEQHDAITRGYISEANLLVFVLDPKNPLKRSHEEALRWLLLELGKVTAAVFVLNKMDEVADIRDADSFESMSATKSRVVREELARLGVSAPDSVAVICVAADPDGMGQEYWRERQQDYDRLSRIQALRAHVDARIALEREELELIAGKAGVIEASRLLAVRLEELRAVLCEDLDVLETRNGEIERRLDAMERKLRRTQFLIREDTLALKKKTLQAVEGATTPSQLGKIITGRLGKGGELLGEELALIVQKHTEEVVAAQVAFADELDESATFFEGHLRKVGNALGKLGARMAKVNPRKVADAILKARDALKVPLKFKPWEALKWGKWMKGAGKALGIFGVVLEGLEVLMEVGNELLLQKRKGMIEDLVTQVFARFEAELAPDAFEAEYFPAVLTAREAVRLAREERRERREQLAQLELHVGALST